MVGSTELKLEPATAAAAKIDSGSTSYNIAYSYTLSLNFAPSVHLGKGQSLTILIRLCPHT